MFERGRSGSTGKSRNQSSFDGSILLTEYARVLIGMKGGAVVVERASVGSFIKGRSVYP